MKNLVNEKAPWFIDLEEGKSINVDGQEIPLAIWNMILTKRDLKLWVECKMKPHRRWRVTDAKTYFGITGTGQTLLDNYMTLFNHVMLVIGPRKGFRVIEGGKK